MGARGPLPDRPATELEQPGEVPRCPAGLLAETRKRWDAFWASPLAGVVNAAYLPALERLFRYYDEWTRVEKEYRSEVRGGNQIVAGTKGQDRLNPLADRILALERAILTLEDKLGLNPMAAARLGIAIGVNKLTWQQVAGQSRQALPAGDVIDVDEVLELPA